jgi:hypothetical protein
MMWDIPEEAITFAQQSLKKFLLTMNEEEAECKYGFSSNDILLMIYYECTGYV